MYTPIPLLQYAVEVIASQYTQSNGRSVPMPTDTSDPQVKTVVRALEDYADYLDWDFYHRDPALRQTEAKLIPLRGVYNFVEYDKTAGPKIQLPQYQPQMASVCADCGSQVGGQDGQQQPDGYSRGIPTGSDTQNAAGLQPSAVGANGSGTFVPGSADGACPQCHSANIQQMTLGVQNAGMVQGRQGAVKRNVVDSFQVEIYDRRRGIEESKHLIYDEILFKTEAKKFYPWLKEVKGTATLGSYETGFLGLHYKNQLEILIANTGKLDQSQPDYMNEFGASTLVSSYYGSFLHDMLCWRRRCWFDTEVYADWTFDKDTQLPGQIRLFPKARSR